MEDLENGLVGINDASVAKADLLAVFSSTIAVSLEEVFRATGVIPGDRLHVDPGMFLVWVELEPVGAKDNVGFEFRLKPFHRLDCAGGCFLPSKDIISVA